MAANKPERHHEETDINAWAVGKAAIALGLGCIAVLFLVLGFFFLSRGVKVDGVRLATYLVGSCIIAGGGLAGVSLTLTGSQNASTTADSGGNFSFSNLDSTGGYTVTPSLAGYVFVPASQTFANMTANPAANFVAWPLPAIAAMGPAFPSALLTTPTTFAPGEIVTLYGANLCSTAASAVPTLPARLAACFVQVDGVNIRMNELEAQFLLLSDAIKKNSSAGE